MTAYGSRPRRPGRFAGRVVCLAAVAAIVVCSGAALAQEIGRSAQPEPAAKPDAKAEPAAVKPAPSVEPSATESFLELQTGVRAADNLTAVAGKPVRLSLNLPTGENFSEANIGQLMFRSYARQEHRAEAAATAGDTMTYTFDRPGYALIVLCAGPASMKDSSDSWQRTTYNTKLVLKVEPDPERAAREPVPFRDGGVTAKVGMKVEVMPLMAPYSIAVPPAKGDEGGFYFPVRVYWEGSKEKHVTIHALGPGDAHSTAETDGQGIANIRLTEPGRWIIRHQKKVDGVLYTGDLVFDAPAPEKEKGGSR